MCSGSWARSGPVAGVKGSAAVTNGPAETHPMIVEDMDATMDELIDSYRPRA